MGPNSFMGQAHAHAMAADSSLPSDLFNCEFCDGTSPVPEVPSNDGFGFHLFACNDRCMALPGDTVFWKFKLPYRIAFRWETATDEELVERGWVGADRPGMLYELCQNYRQAHGETGDGDDGDK